jgi:4-hydroxybenzoate polyprenyltransferase/phosphoserine phosphatase
MSSSARSASPASPDPAALPLVVDLDGTLVRTDTLLETLVRALLSPLALLGAVWALRRGRAALKQALAAISPLSAPLLPYNAAVVELAREARAAGRPVVLATAADGRVADAVAAHLGLFSEVLASRDGHNLKGVHKAAALVERFGRHGFEYVGDGDADTPVWNAARRAVVVGRRRRLDCAEVRHLAGPGAWATVRAVVATARPHQWVKNLLVFVPILAAGRLDDVAGLAGAALAFVAMSIVASTIYLFNDLVDLEHDRRHPRKRRRGFAAGTAPLGVGLVALPLGLVVGLSVAWAAGALSIVLLYVATTLLYSTVVKRIAVADIFVLAALYTLRIVAGGEASGYEATLWLLGFSGFLFLDLAAVKRAGELVDLRSREQTTAAGRGYAVDDLELVRTLGIASAMASAVVLALYVDDGAVNAPYTTPEALWLCVPIVLYWQIRLWIAVGRGRMTDDPILFAVRDRGSVVAGLAVALCVLAAYVAWPDRPF